MNVCIIAPAFPSKRKPVINIFIYKQAKELAKRGHKVFVIGGDTESRVEDNIVIYARPNAITSALLALQVALKIPKESLLLLRNIGLKGTVGRLSLVQITCDLLKREKIDIIDGHGHREHYGAVVAYLVSKIYKCDYVATCHGSDIEFRKDGSVKKGLSKRVKKIVSIALENSSCVIVDSKSVKNDVINYYSKSPKIVHHSVDLTFYKPSKEKIFEKKTIISVGSLTKRKGHEYILRAIKKVLEKKIDVNFIIIGRGPEESNLKGLAKDLEISGSVSFIDFIPEDELPKYYSSSEFFVLATLSEGFGIVFVEAMACGLPIVSTNVAAVPEVVDGAGILVEPRMPDQLAEAMLKLLGNERLRLDLSEKALEQAKKFSVENRITKIEEIYMKYGEKYESGHPGL